MKYVLILLLSLISIITPINPKPITFIPKLVIKDKIDKILDEHIKFANELYRDSIITINPNQFAKMLLVMNYCESGLRSDVISKDGEFSHGIYQFTEKTRKYLNIPDDITTASINQQNEYYKRYMLMVGKSKTQRIKTIIDLHAMNYTPRNMFKNILSSKGTILVRSDLIEFQRKRVKESEKIETIYNSL